MDGCRSAGADKPERLSRTRQRRMQRYRQQQMHHRRMEMVAYVCQKDVWQWLWEWNNTGAKRDTGQTRTTSSDEIDNGMRGINNGDVAGGRKRAMQRRSLGPVEIYNPDQTTPHQCQTDSVAQNGGLAKLLAAESGSEESTGLVGVDGDGE